MPRLMIAQAYLFALVGLAWSEGLLVAALLGFVFYEAMSQYERYINARHPSASSVL